MRIAIHEPRSWQETSLYTLLRALTGGLLLARAGAGLAAYGGFGGLFAAGFWPAFAADFSLGSVRTDAVVQALLLSLAGGALVLGWFTRTAAVLALAVVAWIAAVALAGVGLRSWSPWEAPILLAGVLIYLAYMGGGDWSIDHRLRERSRLRAIREDDTWTRPPYVSTDDPARDAR